MERKRILYWVFNIKNYRFICLSDDNNEVYVWGNRLVNFSGRGPTAECIVKPDIIAPGSDIISCLTPTYYYEKSPDEINIVSDNYMKLSGTSMSTPIITGAIALLLEKHGTISPNEIKYMLKHGTTNLNYPQNQQGWGLINIEKLISEEVYHVWK